MNKSRNTDFNLQYKTGEDAKKFWTQIGGKEYLSGYEPQSFAYQAQEERLIQFLRTIRFKTVLEVGVGFGRIMKLVLDNFGDHITAYHAVDISRDQIHEAINYVNDRDYHKNIISYFCPYAIKEIFPGMKHAFTQMLRSYDLVLAVEVFMHVVPQDLDESISKLGELGCKHLVSVDWQTADSKTDTVGIPDPINFPHDYAEIYRRLFGNYTEMPIPESKQSMFYVDLENYSDN